MKRAFLILLICAMALVCACGEEIETNSTETDAYTQTETATEIDPAETETIPTETDAPQPDAPETEPSDETEFQKPEISNEIKSQYYNYMSSTWQQKIDEINQKQNGDFTFLVQSDVHLWVGSDENAANNAKALSHYVELAFIASPGDLIRGYAYAEDSREDTYKSLEELVDRYTENPNCPILMTFGNHDTNQMWCKEYADATKQINQYDHYYMVTERLKALNGVNMSVEPYCNYYYMDFPEDNVRVIMLNTTDGDYLTEYDSLSTIGQQQREWFKNVALNTDKSVIVMAHIPLLSDFPENNSAPGGSKDILDAVEQFVDNGGDFIAYMYGHVHIQADMTDSNGRLHISFTNGASHAEAVFVNTENRTIRTVGLGKAEDRSFTYGDINE